MRVVLCANEDEVSRRSAALIAREAARRPAMTLGLAAGRSPTGLYRELIAWTRRGLDLSRLTTFGLDDYAGLPADHPALFRHGLASFADEAGIALNRRRWPPITTSRESGPACADYETRIREAGGIALQILGIGGNGHIGFNEPGASLAGRTSLIVLTEETRRANAEVFRDRGEDVPDTAITQGIGTILEAEEIILLAIGTSKAVAVAAAVEGPLTASLPASALQMHPNATVYLDPGAASRLARTGDYARDIALLRRAGILEDEPLPQGLLL